MLYDAISYNAVLSGLHFPVSLYNLYMLEKKLINIKSFYNIFTDTHKSKRFLAFCFYDKGFLSFHYKHIM